MKHLILLLFLPVYLNAQNVFFNHTKEKYWIQREKIKNFLVSGNCNGCGIPANTRGSDDKNNTDGEEITYEDSPWMIGYWIGNLAMEYRLLSQAGADLTQTKKDLFYAIEAIN